MNTDSSSKLSHHCVMLVLCAAITVPAMGQQRLSGKVKIDGSSTVAPVMMAASELYRSKQPRVQITVGISGTGGGFKKFLEKQKGLRTDISNASRTIKSVEMDLARKVGVEFIELPIAYDGIAVVLHKENTWCKDITVEELKLIWSPGSKINNWNQIRKTFPDVPLELYGPGPDSGTFDYFVEAIVGKAKSCRNDYIASEDDNVLVQGVTGDRGALGYFGYAYYAANKTRLGLAAVKNGNAPAIAASVETIRDGSYAPLSRPMFIYVNKTSSYKPQVAAFIEYILTNAKKIVEHPRVNYVALSDELYAASLKRVKNGVTGSVYASPDAKNKSLDELFLNK